MVKPLATLFFLLPIALEAHNRELVGYEPDVIYGTIHYDPPHSYSGGGVTVVDNPDPDDFKSTNLLGRIVKNGSDFYGGAWFKVKWQASSAR